MRLEELDFDLPPALIAQEPAEPRDSCRLMYLGADGRLDHARFDELGKFLRAGDVVVFNDSKVLPARVEGRKASGGVVELLFVRPVASEGLEGGSQRWQALVRPSRRLRAGSEIQVGGSERLTLEEPMGEGRWVVRGSEGASLLDVMERHGRLPLPPYIAEYPEEPSSYQTVYAASSGSAAAPTAGLHFTEALIGSLREQGVETACVTLHVGLDTFLPIREDEVEDHRIHTEWFTVSGDTLRLLRKARSEGRRIVAVGTTTTRVLETLGGRGVLDGSGHAQAVSGSTAIYITPGYRFRVVDTLVTNLHLPRSTVLLLTMAFAGTDRVRASYREAVSAGYRFFSFGDAMLIERPCGDRDEGQGVGVDA